MEMKILPVVLLIVLALVCFWLAARQRKAAGLPPGRVVYSDSGAWQRLEKPLFDPVLGLTGKPDYIIQQAGTWIPIEVKSGFAPTTPHESHVMQLAAYCLLIQRTRDRRPPHGILQYRNRTFAVDYTPELENRLLDLLVEIRNCERRGRTDRSHQDHGRCAGCGFRSGCDQRL
jgi:CRISPR-associated exonuclease Cas4